MSKSASNTAVIHPPTVDGELVRRLRRTAAKVDGPDAPQTLAAFAQRIGVSASYLSNIETRRQSRPTRAVRARIASGLGVSMLAIEASA